MSMKVLGRIETALIAAGFIAIAVDIMMITFMYSLPVLQYPLRAFYVPVLAAESFLYMKQMHREEARYMRAQREKERKEREEQWLREYDAFRRNMHH